MRQNRHYGGLGLVQISQELVRVEMNGPRAAGYAPPLNMKLAGTYYPKSTSGPVAYPDSQRKVLKFEIRVIDELQMIHAVPGNMRRHNSILFRCHSSAPLDFGIITSQSLRYGADSKFFYYRKKFQDVALKILGESIYLLGAVIPFHQFDELAVTIVQLAENRVLSLIVAIRAIASALLRVGTVVPAGLLSFITPPLHI